jgi:transcriptional regulator with XRE-family HTH domain
MNTARRRDDLIARRHHLGHTHESLAEAIGASVSAVSAWERGVRTPRGRLRRQLATALEVNLAELNQLLDPEDPASLSGHEVPGWLTLYESLVHAAGAVRHVEKSQIPGLLQTRRYATVIERIGPVPLSDEEVVRRVDTRMARQAVLHREVAPLQLTSLMAETVLYDRPGGREVMAEQLDHLDRMARRPNVEIRIVPADGSAAAAPCGFELIVQPDHQAPFLAVYFGPDGPHYVERPDVADIFTATFDYLADVALSAAESSRLIRSLF